MTEQEIIDAIRRGMREFSPKTISDTDISAVIVRGVKVLGNLIRLVDEDFFNVRTSLSSNTHVFTWPTNCRRVIQVWDMGTNAGTVTAAAASGTEIQLTVSDHGFEDDDIVVVHDVGGTTEANDTWKVTYVDDDNFTLNGSVFSNTYTSGGKAFQVAGDFERMRRIALTESTMDNDRVWFPRAKTIIVDDPDFTNDIVIDYDKAPSAYSDIHDDFHEGLVAFGVMNLIKVPWHEERDYFDKVRMVDHAQAMWNSVTSQISDTHMGTTAPYNIPDHGDYIG